MGIEEVIRLYEEKQYREVMDKCLVFLEKRENVKEAIVLAINAGIMLDVLEQEPKILEDLIDIATDSMPYIEFQEASRSFCITNNERYFEAIVGALDDFRDNYNNYNPEDVQKLFSNKWLAFSKSKVMLSFLFAQASKKRDDTYDENYDSSVEYDKRKELLLIIECVKSVSKEVIEYLEANRQINGIDHGTNVTANFLRPMFNINNLLTGTIPKKKNDFEEYISEYLELLKLKANNMVLILTSTFILSGQEHSLCQPLELRRDTIEDLKKVYDRIKEYDPSFLAPELPPLGAHVAKSGCYIATAVYGSYDCPEVWTLRRYRDYSLSKSFFGRLLIKTYYSISPTLVNYFGETRLFSMFWKPFLDKMVCSLRKKGYKDTPYKDREW